MPIVVENVDTAKYVAWISQKLEDC
jgi:hypothetical protein